MSIWRSLPTQPGKDEKSGCLSFRLEMYYEKLTKTSVKYYARFTLSSKVPAVEGTRHRRGGDFGGVSLAQEMVALGCHAEKHEDLKTDCMHPQEIDPNIFSDRLTSSNLVMGRVISSKTNRGSHR